MTTRILIDPVTRIEGHAKISLVLGDDDSVASANFHVAEFRGFEKFCEGRPFYEMPTLTSRVCGICPVSHLIASAKACDQILAVHTPMPARKLRRLMGLGQFIQSHALSFFHLSSPDLVLGMESDPVKRNLFGLIAADEEYARGGIRLRQFGQRVIEILGGKRIHPSGVVPGGMAAPLTEEGRAEIEGHVADARAIVLSALERWKRMLDKMAQEVEVFGRFPTLYVGLVTPEGDWEYYEGSLSVMDGNGMIIAENIPPIDYQEYFAEEVDISSYIKPTYYKPRGETGGIYRVGPLARLNLCSHMGVPLADRELTEYRHRFPPPASSSFLYHHARLIEILASIEHISRLLEDEEILSTRIRAEAHVNRLEAVGVSEAPRGTLFHHYQVDEDGLIRRANLLIATGQNHGAMNRTILQIARHYVKGREIPEGILNRIEAGIRAFDPCLSCSTHAFGRMPLAIELVARDGTVVQRLSRRADGRADG
jgi:NAD-reducing hydrogenase large subunit